MNSKDENHQLSVEALLAEQPGLEDAGLRSAARSVFEYAQFLLDDETNLTRVGNLSGDARALLQKRTLELLGEVESGQGDTP